jgi:hypothetical protein
MDNLRKVNLVLLVLWVIFTFSLVVFPFIFLRGSSLAILFAAPEILIFIFLYKMTVRWNISFNINRPYFLRSTIIYSIIMISLFSELVNSRWGILVGIIGLCIILVSLYKAYLDFKNLNLSNTISIWNYILITFHNGRKLKKDKLKPTNTTTQNSDVSKSENNNLYQNITPDKPSSPDNTNAQSTNPTPEAQNTYQQASMNNTPKLTFDTQILNNQNNTSPSSITESMKEIQAEYKSNQNPEENLAQKIQDHYQPEVNSQKIVSEPNPNKLRNLIFSGFLILGFLAFAFLSLGGIVVGDLTVSGVLVVASIILVIDGYLFYIIWFKK